MLGFYTWICIVIVNMGLLNTHWESARALRIISLLLNCGIGITSVLVVWGMLLELLLIEVLKVLSIFSQQLFLGKLLLRVTLSSLNIHQFLRIASNIPDVNLFVFRGILIKSDLIKLSSWGLVRVLHHTGVVSSISGCCFVLRHYWTLVWQLDILIRDMGVHKPTNYGGLLRIVFTLVIQILTLHLRHIVHKFRLLCFEIWHERLNLFQKDQA